ncbi:hypothetical protein CDL15_Pgr018984 [Punica granatum]|uniref:Xaa-Pro aminopeptidase P n=1 Tax=Punica granatum TaxID=22663 RepID=A0A218XKQ4_PUNGR|nr:hypothetical protein CDL15_Pgr018984 [Punica granatum]
MHSLRSPALRPLSLYPNAAFSSSSHSLRFFTRKLPIFRDPKLWPSSSTRPLISIANCSSITAKPSSEIHRSNRGGSESDEKLRALRELFTKPNVEIDAYIVPSQDAHQSEFIAECYMRRAYISGFTGSAGTAVITKDKAALWTDGRYFLQAEKQLSPSWILMRAGNLGIPTPCEWLNDVLAPGCRVGIDPFLFSSDAAAELKEAIAKKNHELVSLYNLNLVDEIWKGTRPRPPNKPIRVHNLKYAGLDAASKLSFLRAEIVGAGASAIIISMLDEVAWLLNLRGSDVPHSPVMYAYLLVRIDSAKLFIDSAKVTPKVMAHLKNAGVELRPYDTILSEIEGLAKEGANLWLDTSSVNAAIVNTYKSACEKYFRGNGNKKSKKSKMRPSDGSTSQSKVPTGVYRMSPISLAKAVKNDAELDGMRNSHLRDAAALAQFWVWLENEIMNGTKLTEVLAQMVQSYTTELNQGHIALDQAVFPENTPGFVLDPFARSSLWKIGLDYRHGTGHGVGAALNVHEGPQSISYRYGNLTSLQKGMIVSNEPGYYEDHAFGIRIENLLCVVEAETPNNFGGLVYLGFEKLTFVPIQTKMIDLSLLSTAEVNWVNDYHAQVWEKVSSLLDGSARQWLWDNTRPVQKQ